MFIERYVQKFYRQSIFDPGLFDEISESDFNDEVIRFRSSYDFHYDEYMNRVFIDKTCGLIYKIVTLPNVQIFEV